MLGMGIGFHTAEKPQTLDEYNNDPEAGSSDIEKRKFHDYRSVEERHQVMVTAWTPRAIAELRKVITATRTFASLQSEFSH
jgi:hypothetical protein